MPWECRDAKHLNGIFTLLLPCVQLMTNIQVLTALNWYLTAVNIHQVLATSVEGTHDMPPTPISQTIT
uniref:Uncharacterized protein n=1 Tax=Oryza glaberrima TaxID=4538 RepID=I1QTB0_ORYGL